jgi:hypothetical protein
MEVDWLWPPVESMMCRLLFPLWEKVRRDCGGFQVGGDGPSPGETSFEAAVGQQVRLRPVVGGTTDQSDVVHVGIARAIHENVEPGLPAGGRRGARHRDLLPLGAARGDVERLGDRLRRQLLIDVGRRAHGPNPFEFIGRWSVGDAMQQGGGGEGLGIQGDRIDPEESGSIPQQAAGELKPGLGRRRVRRVGAVDGLRLHQLISDRSGRRGEFEDGPAILRSDRTDAGGVGRLAGGRQPTGETSD